MFVGLQPEAMAARSKASVCGRSGAEILGSDLVGGRNVFCCECCVLPGRGLCEVLIACPGVLPTVVFRCVPSINLKNEEVMTRFGPQPHNK
jgi:hypothetical protein